MERIAEKIFDDGFPPKRVSLCMVSNFEELPIALEKPDAHFVLFMALDATSITQEQLERVAANLLDLGMVYSCAWGADCGRVEDAFDAAIIRQMPNGSDADVVMTTSHSDESLKDAVWFFLNCAWPAAAYEHSCSHWIASVIGNPEWEGIVRDTLLRNDL